MDPAAYASSGEVQKKWILLIINEFAEELKKISGKCMDIGCGPGNVTRSILLPSLGPNATMLGTDISETMIEFANKMHGEQSVKFEVLNVETKNLPEKYISNFDHIFSFNALHWCQNFRSACENMHRMLRPGGTILILLLASHDVVQECLKILKQDLPFIRYDRGYLSPFHSSIRPKEELSDLLEDVGFTVRYCNIREMMFTAKDTENLQSSLASFLLNEVSVDEQEKFKENFKRLYKEVKIKYYSQQPWVQQTGKESDIVDMAKIKKHRCRRKATNVRKYKDYYRFIIKTDTLSKRSLVLGNDIILFDIHSYEAYRYVRGIKIEEKLIIIINSHCKCNTFLIKLSFLIDDIHFSRICAEKFSFSLKRNEIFALRMISITRFDDIFCNFNDHQRNHGVQS